MKMGLEIPRDKPSTILMELITSLQIPSAQSVMLYWQNVVCLTIQNSLGFISLNTIGNSKDCSWELIVDTLDLIIINVLLLLLVSIIVKSMVDTHFVDFI